MYLYPCLHLASLSNSFEGYHLHEGGHPPASEYRVTMSILLQFCHCFADNLSPHFQNEIGSIFANLALIFLQLSLTLVSPTRASLFLLF